MRWKTLPALLAVSLAGACDTPMEPQPLSPAAGMNAAELVAVPFSARADFSAAPGTATLYCAPAALELGPPQEYVGVGTATHMGKSTVTLAFDECAFDPTGATYFAATGHAVVTAANGDELWSTWTLTQQLDGSFTIDALAIVGGTGRFAGATGTLTGAGSIDLGTFEGYYTLTGSISRPNR